MYNSAEIFQSATYQEGDHWFPIYSMSLLREQNELFEDFIARVMQFYKWKSVMLKNGDIFDLRSIQKVEEKQVAMKRYPIQNKIPNSHKQQAAVVKIHVFGRQEWTDLAAQPLFREETLLNDLFTWMNKWNYDAVKLADGRIYDMLQADKKVILRANESLHMDNDAQLKEEKKEFDWKKRYLNGAVYFHIKSGQIVGSVTVNSDSDFASAFSKDGKIGEFISKEFAMKAVERSTISRYGKLEKVAMPGQQRSS